MATATSLPDIAVALALEQLSPRLFRAPPEHLWHPFGARGVFGGQVIGQALAAAGKVAPEGLLVHSTHCQFLAAGDAGAHIIYAVKVLRVGRSFAQMLVEATQDDKDIFAALVSFHRFEDSPLDYQRRMPAAPAPEGLPTRDQRLDMLLQHPQLPPKYVPVVQALKLDTLSLDWRNCDTEVLNVAPRRPQQRAWMRAATPLGGDKSLHRCVAACASDLMFLGIASLPVGGSHMVSMAVSLDHTIWFHTDFRADEWMLYDAQCNRATGGRALVNGWIYRRDGTLAMTVAQEGVIRLPPGRPVSLLASEMDTEEGDTYQPTAPRAKL